jgi:hypothetical protein
MSKYYSIIKRRRIRCALMTYEGAATTIYLYVQIGKRLFELDGAAYRDAVERYWITGK